MCQLLSARTHMCVHVHACAWHEKEKEKESYAIGKLRRGGERGLPFVVGGLREHVLQCDAKYKRILPHRNNICEDVLKL